MKSKKRKNRDTRHHILPSSRGGNDHPENIASVKDTEHKSYHQIFGNMSPDEIITYLVEKYWNDQWKWVMIALNEKEWTNEES